MGTSRWGDMLDILTSDAAGATLSLYPVIVMAGHVNMTDTLLATLSGF